MNNLFIYLISYFIIGIGIALFIFKYFIIPEVESKKVGTETENRLISGTMILVIFLWPFMFLIILYIYIRDLINYVN